MTQNIDSTVFNRTDNVSDYTYPVELPLTDQAITTLGFPISLANPTPIKIYDAFLRVDGLHLGSVRAMVQVTSLSKKTISVSLLGNYAVLSAKVGSKKVNELTLDGDRFAPSTGVAPPVKNFSVNGYNFQYKTDIDMLTWMQQIAMGTVVTDFAFPSAVDYGTNIDGIHESDSVNFINAYDAFLTFTYVDPIWHYIRTRYISNMADAKARHWWVPMFKLTYVLRKCFEELGMAVAGNIFSDPNFAKLLLYNTYAINGASASVSNAPTVITQNSRVIHPSNHMPAMGIMDFVQEVCKRYNIDYYFDISSNTVVFTSLKNGATSFTSSLDLTPVAVADPEINYVLDSIDGYAFSFDPDSADALSTDYDKDVAGYTYGGSVNLQSQLSGVVSTGTKELWFVRSLNQYFVNDNGWNFFADNVLDFQTSTSGQVTPIRTKALSMPMRTATYSVSTDDGSGAVAHSNMILPASEIGIAGGPFFRMTWRTGGGSSFPFIFDQTVLQKISINPHLISYYGMRVFTGSLITFSYPFATSGTADMKGVTLTGYSGSWHNPDNNGLYDQFWYSLVMAIAKSLGIELQVLLDVVTFSKISINHTFFWYQNLRWLCSKAEFNMPFPSISKLTLVRA